MIGITILIVVLTILYSAVVLFFIIGWCRTPHYHPKPLGRYPKVSVIIPVRNEAGTIKILLDDLMKQDYPSEAFEVIVIDDDSDDGTKDILQNFHAKNVRVIELDLLENFNAYKKMAITVGVNASTAELILSTDGDCRIGPRWISTIVSYYLETGSQFISSPVCFHEEDNWYEKMQTVEFQYLISAGAGCITNGRPLTANGANMAYTRELFLKMKGYEEIDEQAHGDDEHFLQKVYKSQRAKIGFLKHTDALVMTFAKQKLSDFIQQRKRWATKSGKYFDLSSLAIVSIVFVYNLALLILFPFTFLNQHLSNLFIGSLLLKSGLDGFLMFLSLRFVGKSWYILYMPLVEVFYILYVTTIGVLGNLGSTYKWKGRVVK